MEGSGLVLNLITCLQHAVVPVDCVTIPCGTRVLDGAHFLGDLVCAIFASSVRVIFVHATGSYFNSSLYAWQQQVREQQLWHARSMLLHASSMLFQCCVVSMSSMTVKYII